MAWPDSPEFDGRHVRGSVLVVDDDQATREIFQLVLANAGYVVKTADTLSRVLAVASEGPFDVALVDLRLGHDNGLEAIPHLRPARIVIVTAFGDMASAVQALRLGAVDYLEKPLIDDDLLDVVRRHVPTRSASPDEDPLSRVVRAALDPAVPLWDLAGLLEPIPADHCLASMEVLSQALLQVRLDSRVLEFLTRLESLDDAWLRLSEKEWAEQFRIDAAHFGRLVLRQTARGFRHWRRLARVRRAAQLLALPQEHPKSIAFTVGFNDWSHFRREFRRTFGVWPLEFRSLVCSH